MGGCLVEATRAPPRFQRGAGGRLRAVGMCPGAGGRRCGSVEEDNAVSAAFGSFVVRGVLASRVTVAADEDRSGRCSRAGIPSARGDKGSWPRAWGNLHRSRHNRLIEHDPRSGGGGGAGRTAASVGGVDPQQPLRPCCARARARAPQMQACDWRHEPATQSRSPRRRRSARSIERTTPRRAARRGGAQVPATRAYLLYH